MEAKKTYPTATYQNKHSRTISTKQQSTAQYSSSYGCSFRPSTLPNYSRMWYRIQQVCRLHFKHSHRLLANNIRPTSHFYSISISSCLITPQRIKAASITLACMNTVASAWPSYSPWYYIKSSGKLWREKSRACAWNGSAGNVVIGRLLKHQASSWLCSSCQSTKVLS